MNKVLVIQTFSKSFFFFHSLGWATVRHRRSLGRCATFACFGDSLLEISSFALKKRSPPSRLLWRLFSSIENFWGVDLEQIYCFAKLCIGHTRVLGSTRVSWLLRNPVFRRYYYYVFHKRERTFAISCSWWVDDWLKYPLCYARRGVLNRLRFCT